MCYWRVMCGGGTVDYHALITAEVQRYYSRVVTGCS